MSEKKSKNNGQSNLLLENTALSDEAHHLLVIDDDRRIRDLISRYLTANGFRITTAANALEARNHLKGLEFDLMIVDVMMPGETGISFTQSLNDEREIPILMLTALAEIDNRLEGLEAGADDYLTKPFDPRELLLRINNILKRAAKPEQPVIENISFGPFQFSVNKRELKRDNETIRLTEREQEIMIIFANKAGETVARHELLGSMQESGERKIDVQMNRLRQKIEDDPSDPKWLQTVRGIGYRLYSS